MAELIDRADVVFHLAAAVGVKLIVEAPVRTIETNVHGTEVVLKHASKKNKLVVIFSTSEVYGKSTAVPFHEDADLVMGPTPQASLGVRVQQGDRRVPRARLLPRAQAAGRSSSGSSTPSGRGRPGRYGMVIPNFVRQALAGEPITVYGDGTQTRSFTVRRRRRRRPDRGWCSEPRAIGQVFNIGNTEEISILRSRASACKAMTGSASRDRAASPTTRPTRRASRTCRAACRTWRRSHGLVGYRPTLGLDEILRARHRRTRAPRPRPPARIDDNPISRGSDPTRAVTSPSGCSLANAKPIRKLLLATGRDRAPPSAGHRPDREHEPLQREVRVLPARRNAPPAGRDGHGSVQEDRRRVRRARHHARARPQLRRAVSRSSSSSRRCATRSRRASRKSG